MSHEMRPRRLEQNLSTQTVGSELLVYDEVRHQAFCLNATSAAVWNLCDGNHTIAGIAQSATLALAMPVSDDLVRFALSELRRDGLLETEAKPMVAAALSRRAMMRRMGTGAALMLPAVAMVMAPQAAQAYTGCFNCGPVPRGMSSSGMPLGAPTQSTHRNLTPGFYGAGVPKTSGPTHCSSSLTTATTCSTGSSTSNPFLP